MNTKLLRKVQKHILAVPERLDMDFICDLVDPEEKGAPPCGTVGCIAGWAHLLTMKKFPITEAGIAHVENRGWNAAKRKLGLTPVQAERLFTEPFFANDEDGLPAWPMKFARRYLDAKTAKARAKATSDRIDHFIKTKGAE